MKNFNLKFSQSMDQIEGDLLAKDEKIEDLEDKFQKTQTKDAVKQAKRNKFLGSV